MIHYRNIIILLLSVLIANVGLAQKDTNEVFSNFEQNYNELLHSYYMRQNEKHYNTTSNTSSTQSARQTSDETYKQRLKQIISPVKLVYNNAVRNNIIYYLDTKGDRVSVMLGISKYYFPIFENILESYGVPNELKYLVVIESAFNPRAVSKAGATGLWQFMYATGKTYDLRINSVVDDRRDVVKSTIAAAKYLKDLYSIYHDWSLVLAAYNCGPGNVNKAIKRSGKNDFWEIYSYLPRETRGYVPAFIAATYVMNFADKHGIYPAEMTKPLDLIHDTVIVKKDIYFDQITKVMNIPIEQLREMNPQYKMDYIPGTIGEYSLRLPLKEIENFIELEDSIASVDKDKYNSTLLANNGTIDTVTSNNGQTIYVTKTINHKVRNKETWSSIARRYGVSVKELRSWNKKITRNRLRKGTILKVEQRVAVENKQYIPANKESNESIVKEQDNIVASNNANNQVEQQKTNITNNNTSTAKKDTKQTKKDTQQTKKDTQKAKKDTTKQSKNQVTHTIKSGETIAKIAKKYNVKESEILRLNSLNQKTARKIKPGQKLRIK